MANENWEIETLQYIVARVAENALRAEKGSDDFHKGKRMAYYEILDTIKTELFIVGENMADFGLDFDIESILK